MTTTLLAIAVVLLLVAAHDLVRRPLLRRQALRNLVRRPGETGLMIGGALLGTAIITASFVVGDTVTGTIRDVARTNLGAVDEAITTDDPATADAIWVALESTPLDGTDGLLRSTGGPVAVSRSGAPGESGADANRLADSSVWAYELDFESAKRFSGDVESGLEGTRTPNEGQVTISRPLADTLEAQVGDLVEVHAYGQSLALEVSSITPRIGLGGRATDNVHLAPGTLDDLHAASNSRSTEAAGPIRFIYISNNGGVLDSVQATNDVMTEISNRLDSLGIPRDAYDLGDWKADLLADAEAEGDEFTTIFSSIGAFAVISGVLLVINIVAMLTEERRAQLGTLRALGLRRSQIVRLMALEGTAYAIASTALGVVAGLGIGWIVAGLTAEIFEQDRLNLVFTVDRSSLVLATAVGLVLTLGTVWIASSRLARMNIIAAIRDLETPPSPKRRRRAVLGGGGLVVVGSVLFYLGSGSNSAVPALLCVPFATAGLGLLISDAFGARLTASIVGAIFIGWGIAVFSLIPGAMDNPEISVFVFQGVVLVAGAVLLSTANQSVWERAIGRFGTGRRGVSLRLGLAYPLARPVRSSMLLAMFSLVIFTITFMAVLVAVFDNEGDSIADQTAAGFEVVVENRRNSPVSTSQLLAIDGVDSVADLDRRWFSVRGPRGLVDRPMTAVDQAYLREGGAELVRFDPAFGSAADTWQAVVNEPGLVIVDEFLFGDRPMNPGDIVIYEDSFGDPVNFEVAGVVRADWLWNAVYTSTASMKLLDDEAVEPSRFFVSGDGSIDADEVAATINGSLLEFGVDASSVQAIVEEELAQQNGFIRILQGYLGLGLLVGVAGLGIVLIRAVRERRREIGTLRAMGYPSQTIRLAFLTEATFISAQGVLMGVALGTVTAWQVVTNVDAFAAGSMDFVVPLGLVAAIAIVPVLASLAAAALPAKRAASTTPAVALRITS